MSRPSKFFVTSVRINELKNNMTILAYTGFSDQYENISQQVCHFLQRNFGGAKAKIERKSKVLEIPVEKIQEGDSILKLFSFPESLTQFTKANPKLIAAFRKRGILAVEIKKVLSQEFDTDLNVAIHTINQLMKTPSKKQQRLEKGLFEANSLIERVQKAYSSRAEGSKLIQDMMDNARAGRLNSAELENYVESIIKNSTAAAMSAIMNLRASDQTYSHCIDVGVLFQHLYFLSVGRHNHKSIFATQKQAMLGAFLHDFGKAKLPKELLDSKIRFESNSREMELIRSHPKYGASLLNGMNMPNSIIKMSLCHHIKMDETLNTSYPRKIPYSKTNFESRLLALVDIYQALVGKRTYKRSWTPPQAIRYLSALVDIEYEEKVWKVFYSLIGEYPVGSLVVLSDDSMGFVMNVPETEEDLTRPMVAVVRNSAGEDLERHTLLDLQEDQDIQIKNDLDANDAFDTHALKKFAQLNLVA